MRLLTILGAHLVSCLVAGLAIMGATVLMGPPTDGAIAHTLASALLITPFIAVFAALPALALIAYAERYDRHSATFYAIRRFHFHSGGVMTPLVAHACFGSLARIEGA